MSEPTVPPPDPADEPPAAPTTQPARRHHLLAWLTGAGLLILAAGLLWVWQHPALPPPSEQTEALARRFDALEARVTRLEQRPQPQGPDLGPLTARLIALEQRPPQPAAAAPDLAPLEARLAAIEQRQPPNLAPLEARIAAQESAARTMQADLSRRLDADETRLAAIEQAARRMPLVQAATLALAAGQKLGELPGAPPALARFAIATPPTEAALRLAFPQAARAALAAAHPATDGEPLLTRLWAKAQDLVTIRQGDRVLVGDPAAGVLAHARAALDAGDLAAAAAEVATLQGAAAQAMATWLEQARALLEARAALAAWAASG
jgi:hypothetical protein